MALNLKNPHTLRAIDELARQTGKSKSDAVASAVEASLADLLREREASGVETSEQRLARIEQLAQDSAARFAAAGMGPDPQTGQFQDLVGDLYDAEGLPR